LGGTILKTPYLKVDLQKIKNNVKVVNDLCKKNSLDLTVVTKVIEGEPEIVKHIRDVVNSIGDSRICDIKRMHRNGINGNFMLIRSPSISDVKDVIKYCDISLNTEIEVLKSLGEVARAKNTSHKVIIMLEIGDLREGVLLEDFESFLFDAIKFKGINIIGIGANATCLTGLIPSEKNLKILEDASKIFKKLLGFEPIVSGGASNLIPLMLKQKVPSYISNVRIGEGIMIGVDAIYKERIPGCFTDCFKLGGEIIELKTKPTSSEGNFREQAKNVFGEIIKYKETGLRKRAILNIGKLDTDIKGVKPIDDKIEVIGGTSDHLVLDVENAPKLRIGDLVEFTLNYSALLFAMNSPYVRKTFINSPLTS
jgi:predicted amino acid racemase